MIKQKKVTSLFFNACFDKNQLKNLLAWILDSYGEKSTIDFLEKLKQVGFHEATQAGISLGLEDLQIPNQKARLISQSLLEISAATQKSFAGNITAVEKSQQLIDIWNQMSETLRHNAVQNFRNTNPVNPVFMMAFSGARGNISQVRQLVAMRGLMADPQGAILEFPIQSNFREGLTITEYLISCYGARKGLVDTALRTATSGYLTRRLVDAVQHIVVTMSDCQTSKGVFVKKNLESRLIGRILGENLLLEKNKLIEKNQIISPKLSKIIASRYKKVLVRSPLTCEAQNSICQLCYGADLAHRILVNIGEAVGVIAAQSIGEPGTQLTMRTFHTGGVGVFSNQATKPIFSPFDGRIEFPDHLIGHFIRTPHGNILYMVKYFPTSPTRIVLKIKPIDISQKTYIVEEQELPAGSVLLVRQNQYVKSGQLIAQSFQIKTAKQEMPESTHPIQSPIEGEIFFESMVIWTHQQLSSQTKKQKLKEKENLSLPDIRTLGKLGNFWVFSSSNQQKSNFINTFLRSGDLVSQKSFLFNYNFKISQKSQLKRLKSKLVIGQSWNKMSIETMRFQKFGYCLTLSPAFSTALLIKNKSIFISPSLSKVDPRPFYFSNSINFFQEKTKRQLFHFFSPEIIFYIKNSTLSSKKQFLIWFPSHSKKSSGSFLEWTQTFKFITTSYFSSLKNYSFSEHFTFSDHQKINSFNSLALLSRTKLFLNKHYIFKLKFKKNNFFSSSDKISFLEMWFFKIFRNLLNFETLSAFYCFYNQHFISVQPSLFFTKKSTIIRNFELSKLRKKSFYSQKFLIIDKESSLLEYHQNKKLNFLIQTLTKTKVLIFHKSKKTNHYTLTPKTNWIYIPSTKNLGKKVEFNWLRLNVKVQSKFVFLEQGKKIENFIFSNFHVSLKFVPKNFLKIISSSSTTNFYTKNFIFSSGEFLNLKSIELDKNLLKNVVIRTKKSFQKKSNEIFVLYSASCPKNKIGINKKQKIKDAKRLYRGKDRWHKWVFLKKQQTNFSKETKKITKISKSFPYITFYTRNTNFDFVEKTACSSRLCLPVKDLKKTLTLELQQGMFHPTYCIFISKISEESFFNQNELKNKWVKLQLHNHEFDVKSPLNSKQTATLFSPQNKPKIKFQAFSLQDSGWVFGQKNFRVNITFQLISKLNQAQPNLKFTTNFISCKPPLNFFSLFFYDFVAFQTADQFHFKLFSNSWLLPNKSITQGFLKVQTFGEFRRFTKSQNQNISSILKISDLITFKQQDLSQKQFQNLSIGQLIRWGQEISPNTASIYNGRIIALRENSLIIRLGVPFLASSRGILHVNHGDLIQSNNLLVTLKSRRLQTEDIVQGIPKIEQLFEARETQGGEILNNNVHILLQNYFVEALKIFPLDKSIAVSKSVTKIQRFLIENILAAYLNQGVKISEKHVEIVVRQMTTKVRILSGGHTGLVQGELVQLRWIQEINKKLKKLNLEQATYEPIVLGISKSVLQSESFLLAASFQEVSRVLVKSALSRKTDFLRGLHENVILGQLIPAGTGLLIENRSQIESAPHFHVSLHSPKN